MHPTCRDAELLFPLLSLTVARDVLALSCSFATDSVDFVLHDRELPGRVFGVYIFILIGVGRLVGASEYGKERRGVGV